MNPYRTSDAPNADEPEEPAKPKWKNPYAPDPTVRPLPWDGTTPEKRFGGFVGFVPSWLLAWLEDPKR